MKRIKQEEPTNNILFEKLEYEMFKKDVISDELVFLRPIAPNVYKGNITLLAKRVFNELWFQINFYYKYNTYQKFPIATKVEFCAFFNGAAANPVFQMLVNTLLNLEKELKLGFKLQCPLTGTISVTAEHFNFSHINLPLLPAGRFRVDVEALEHTNGPSLFILQAYFKISDLRVWF